MASQVDNPELVRALEELHSYLSDQLPPLMVAESIEVLLEQSPQLMATGIHSWVSGLTQRDTSIPLSDYLYHAITKIYQMQEYKLIQLKKFAPFFEELRLEILKFCPPEDREFLRQNLELLGKTAATNLSSAIGVVRRQTVAAAPQAQADPEKEKEAHRFGFLLSRLGKRLSGLVGGKNSDQSSTTPAATIGTATAMPAIPQRSAEEVVTEALADAARNANEATELQKVLEHLKLLGVQVGPDDLFRALGKSLPGWSLPQNPDVALPENSNLQAMHRIISKAPNLQEAANHFRHLIKAAVERFNEGFLPQSASMFDLASRIINAKEVDAKAVELVVMKGHENLDETRLRKYGENPDQHSLLRKILNFFPAMMVQGLIEAIYDCPKRERRKLFLLLLDCHGEPARKACLKYLRQPLNKDTPDIELWYRRNLIFLLRRIPMSTGETLEYTVDTLLPYVDLKLIPMIIKETLAYLPMLRHDKVEQALKRMILQLEAMILKPESAPYELKEVHQIADRVVACLCRLGTAGARKAILDHALKKKPDNEAIARLVEFANLDLSEDSETRDRLLEALQSTIPIKRLGIVQRQKDFMAKCIAQAFAGTAHLDVLAALQDLVQRYPECESGQAATASLAKLEQAKTAKRTETPSVSLMGDLEVFGLPSLLQNLADSTVTGTLTLKNNKGETYATVSLIKGKLRESRCGVLSGDSAFFQMFERPQPGTFQFVRALEPTGGAEAGLPEILPFMLEALRRYDEVQQMRAVIPDDARLKVKAVKPSSLPKEKDGLLFRDLWTAVQNGATAAECEATIVFDCYRVRRLLSHWVESGVIEAV